jgi:hypothetical protein
VTIGRNAPLDEAGWRILSTVFVSEKAKYFSQAGLTRTRKISPTGKSDFQKKPKELKLAA